MFFFLTLAAVAIALIVLCGLGLFWNLRRDPPRHGGRRTQGDNDGSGDPGFTQPRGPFDDDL